MLANMLPLPVLLLAISTTSAQGVWPAPLNCSFSGNATVYLSADFSFGATAAQPSGVLTAAFARYSELLQLGKRTAPPAGATLAALRVDVASADDTFSFGVDESYVLDFTGGASASTPPAATLTAPTVWGALRGLETFAQLTERDNIGHTAPLQAPAPPASVADAPRFSYRGLMIDVARHFYPVDFIEKHIMAAMEASKLNVLHVHLTDDQSFPVASARYPALAAKGAFGPKFIYSAADLKQLVASATARGIHLVPEFDMPAHTSMWGAGHPEIMVTDSAGDAGCSIRPGAHGDTMDPSTNATFELIDGLLGEMATGPFGGSEFLHLGGDEVPEACWLGSKRVRAFMAAQGISSADELESYFVNRVAAGEQLVAANKTLVYWEEIFNNNVSLPPTAVIQAWKTNAMPGVVAAGHRTTNSYKWYLNHGCNNYGTLASPCRAGLPHTEN